MYSKVSQLYIPYTTLFILFFFLTMLSGMQDLSFPNRDQTCAPCSGSTKSLPLNHQEGPLATLFRFSSWIGHYRVLNRIPCAVEYVLIISSIYRVPRWLSSKESACNAGDRSLIPELGRSPGAGNGNPLWCYCLGNPMDGGAWQSMV